MKGKTKKLYLLVLAVISIALLAGSLLTPGMAKHESIQEAMKDAVLHESNRIALFGMEVNPALLSDLILVGTLLLAAVLEPRVHFGVAPGTDPPLCHSEIQG